MFKSVLIIVCALVSVGLCGNNGKNWLQHRSLLVDVFATTCSTQFSCLDCKTARICKPDGKGGFQQITTIPCPASTPYCNDKTGTCSTQPDDSCGSADASFICLDDGYFPDKVCSIYHVCKGYTAYKYQCAIAGEYYDANQQACRTGIKCGTFTCGAAGVKVAHNIYPEYFGYCNVPNGSPAVIDRCKGSYEMNTTSQLCEPVCHTAGVQEDIEDCTKYFKCHLMYVPDASKSEGWVQVMMKDHLDCPKNTAFDRSQFICVDINETSCKPKK